MNTPPAAVHASRSRTVSSIRTAPGVQYRCLSRARHVMTGTSGPSGRGSPGPIHQGNDVPACAMRDELC